MTETTKAELVNTDPQFEQTIKLDKDSKFNFFVHGKKIKYSQNSLYFFDDTSAFRQKVVWLVEWMYYQFMSILYLNYLIIIISYFDRFIITIILLNTISLTMQDYSDRRGIIKPVTWLTHTLDVTEILFSLVFISEFLLKTIAMGFIREKNSYLRNSWNILDFIVVLSSLISFLPGVGNFSAIRTFRILRPLKSLNQIQGLKVIISALLDSIPALGSVLVFLIFIIFLFAILGLQLFVGIFYQRCRLTQFPTKGFWKADPDITSLCNDEINPCPNYRWCGAAMQYNLLENQAELHVEDLNYGVTTFDDIFLSFFTVSQVMIAEEWTFLADSLKEAYNSSIINMYFILLSILGQFYVMNLVLAVFTQAFSDVQEQSSQPKAKKTSYQLEIDNGQENSDEEGQNKGEDEEGQEQQVAMQPEEQEVSESENSQMELELEESAQPGQPTTRRKSVKGNVFIYFKQFFKFLKIQVHALVQSNFFVIFINICILANTFCLALDRINITQYELEKLEVANIIFTIIFTLELLLQIWIFGFQQYLKVIFHQLDAFIVVVSIVDLAISSQQKESGHEKKNHFNVLLAFRTLRLFRVIKLAKSWQSLKQLLKTITTTTIHISQYMLLLILFFTIGALLGMELFSYRIQVDLNGEVVAEHKLPLSLIQSPTLNYDNFYIAFISTFILSTGDNWEDTMLLYFQATQSWQPAYYFFAVKILGKFILLKLYLAILINKFSQIQEVIQKKYLRRTTMNKNEMKQQVINLMKSSLKDNQQIKSTIQLQQNQLQLLQENEDNQQKKRIDTVQSEYSDKAKDQQEPQSPKSPKQKQKNIEAISQKFFSITKFEPELMSEAVQDSKQASQNVEFVLEGKSLFLFDENNRFRIFIYKIVTSPYFDNIALVFIMISSLTLSLEQPLENPDNEFHKALDIVNNCTTVFFLFELMLKIIAQGFMCNGDQSYLQNSGNYLDFTVVMLSLIDFLPLNSVDLKQFKVIRTLRVMRPLRIISRNEGLKIALNSIVRSLENVFQLTLITFIIFTLFAVFAVNILKGKLDYCDTSNIETKFIKRINTKTNCFDYGGDWVKTVYNYDNTINALICLFNISLADNWSDFLWSSVSAVDVDMQPINGHNLYWAAYHIFFLNMGSFFLLNVFAGIVVDSFSQEADTESGFKFLSKSQQDWVTVQQRCLESTPDYEMHLEPEANIFKRIIFQIINFKYFENFIMVCVILNSLQFCLEWYGENQEIEHVTKIINLVFLIIFTFESAFKIIIMKKIYFNNTWNQFDFTIIIVTYGGMFLEYLGIFKNIGTTISLLRIIRVMRILRLVRRVKTLKMLFQTFVVAIPSLANIGALLLLTLFIFSIIGMDYFPFILFAPKGLNKHINFTNFSHSIYTLYIAATGQGFPQILQGVVQFAQPNYACVDIGGYEDYIKYGLTGCGKGFGYQYLIIFELISAFIVLNLFLTFILDGYGKQSLDLNSIVNPQAIELFQQSWKQFDRAGTGFIPLQKLYNLLSITEKPLGWAKSVVKTKKQKRKSLKHLIVPIYVLNCNELEPLIFYYDILDILMKRRFYIEKGYSTISNNVIQNKLRMSRYQVKSLYLSNKYSLSEEWTFQKYLFCSKFIRRVKYVYKTKKGLIEEKSEYQVSDNFSIKELEQGKVVSAKIGNSALIFNILSTK